MFREPFEFTLKDLVKKELDNVANQHGYDTIISACSYVESDVYRNEAIGFIKWRDLSYSWLFNYLNTCLFNENLDPVVVVNDMPKYVKETIPQSITKVQAMRAMKQTDVNTTANTTMWTSFQALLASNVDANDEWLLALDLQRNHPLVLALTPTLGKTPAQIDELFILASGL